MRQEINGQHLSDPQGNPAGGVTRGTGIEIHWQAGPLGRGADRVAPSGAFVEGVIAAALDRLQHYQQTRFACLENGLAIEKLEEALRILEARTVSREARSVEGTHDI